MSDSVGQLSADGRLRLDCVRWVPAGVRWDINITPTPVQKILDDTIAKWPDRPAIEFMGKRMSYRELGHHVNRAARGLQQLGVKPGVHVGRTCRTPHTTSLRSSAC